MRKWRLIFNSRVLTTAENSAGDSKGGRRLILSGTVVHIRVPPDLLFICGSEPLSVPAMIEALKLFINECSTSIFVLEIETKS